ncbi:hypothetical protein C7I55_16375 [Sphingomonas deserti]|uniref:DUF4071 domain-containing protein n=1 Tax=Allosphingosinicella deserti TaxID=2116704 RepID=A0A2P7QLQ0_9SPHN|nr:hypothetical protein C7I55_16375 [Sphingomonas deserti]
MKGRLLKDNAIRATGHARRALYREAADAYAEAGRGEQSTYPLINAASLALLSGEPAEARELALRVLQRIEDAPEEPETPYYRAATKSEALLLLNQRSAAEDAFAEAIALAPSAWEDHASTLRQFELILSEQRQDSSWLNAYRPPRSLHFGGHMSFEAAVGGRRRLVEAIAATLEAERVGFGFGALAAGADILIAEALLERGGALHLVLPGGAGAFAACSVDPFGADWRKRFDRALAQAETIRSIRPIDIAPDVETIRLADEVAMGAALINASRLESQPVQILVIDTDAAAAGGSTGAALAQWAAGGWRQHLIRAPREAIAPDLSGKLAPVAHRRALAVLCIQLDDLDGPAVSLSRAKADLSEYTRAAVPPYLADDQVLLAFEDATEAAHTALGLADAGWRVGGDYIAVVPFTDPFSGGERLPIASLGPAKAAANSTPAGTACVTDDFAAALAVSGHAGPTSELVGELELRASGAAIELFVLRPRST